jgi:hypothetical protein
MYLCIMYICMYVWMDGWMHVYVCMYVCMDGWIDGWMSGWMVGWMGGCMCMYVCMCYMYVRMYVCMYVCMHACVMCMYVEWMETKRPNEIFLPVFLRVCCLCSERSETLWSLVYGPHDRSSNVITSLSNISIQLITDILLAYSLIT